MPDEVGIQLKVRDRTTFSREMRTAADDVEHFGAAGKSASLEAASSTKQLAATAEAAGTSLKRVGERAGAVASKMKFVSLGIGAGFLYASKAASDLTETASFTQVTFKGATDQMLRWSRTTIDSMGIARQSALDAANQFGGLFNLLGQGRKESAQLSQQMVQLAVDMSSAKNVSLDEAVVALGSGLRGEAEPLRRFNVLLSDATIQAYALKKGIIGQKDEMTEAQKVQARLGLIMQQTKDIQGDYARTADSAANAQRRAQEAAKNAAAELGQNLAPVTAKVADVAGDVAQAFARLPDRAQTGVVAIAGVVAAIAPLAKAVSGMVQLWTLYTIRATAAAAATTSVGTASAGASVGIGAFAAAAAPVAAVAAAGAAAVYSWNKALNEKIATDYKQMDSMNASWALSMEYWNAVKAGRMTIFEYREKVEQLASEEGIAAEEAARLRDQSEKLSRAWAEARTGADKLAFSVNAVEEALRSIPRNTPVRLTYREIGSLSEIAGSGTLRTRATGGPVTALKPYLVGERGPELMVPKISGEVVSNQALTNAAGEFANKTVVIEKGAVVVQESGNPRRTYRAVKQAIADELARR